MTKADIVRTLHQQVGLSKTMSQTVIDSILDKVSSTLNAGEDVQISSFGHFMVRQKSARIGRNPRTGQRAEITARHVITFRPSKNFKQSLLEKDAP